MSALLDHLQQYWLVHILLTLYTGMLAYHAWTGHRQTKGLADYYVGGRAIGGVTIGLSFFATYSSTNSFVGFAGKAYAWGAPWLLLVPFVLFFSVLAWVAIAPRLRRFTESLDSLTLPDFIGYRFDSPASRVSACVILLFAGFFYMTAVFKGIGNLLEVFLEIPYTWAIVIVFLIVMIYTVVGGFISVVKTDSVQGAVMILAAILLFAGTVKASGGLTSLRLLADQPGSEKLFDWNAGVSFPFLLGVLFAGTVKFIVEPRQLSRFYALQGPEAIRVGLWVSTLAFLLVYSILVPIGLYARRIFPEGIGDTDLVVPRLLTEGQIFSDGVGAFLLLAMVSAAMSSLDSVLLVMASSAERDLVGMLRKRVPPAAALGTTRWFIVLFALLTALFAIDPPGGIVTLTALSGALYAACFFPSVVLGLYWRKGNGKAVVTSFGAGVSILATWNHLPAVGAIHPVFPALLLSLLSFVLVAVLTTTPEESAQAGKLFDE